MSPDPAATEAAHADRNAVEWSDLLLRPDRFFGTGPVRVEGTLLVVLIVCLGIGAMIDRMDLSALTRVARGDDLDSAAGWGMYWGTVLAAGLLAGPVSYFLWGWWYGIRVRWSGAPHPEGPLSRRIFLLTTSVVTVPTIILTTVDTALYAGPAAIWQLAPSKMTLMVVPFLSVFVSYRAVVASFPVNRTRALVWFALLPALVYGASLVVGALAGVGIFAE